VAILVEPRRVLCGRDHSIHVEGSAFRPGTTTSRLDATVSYAFGTGPVRTREVHWEEPPPLAPTPDEA